MVVLVDLAAEDLPALDRRVQRHDGRLVMIGDRCCRDWWPAGSARRAPGGIPTPGSPPAAVPGRRLLADLVEAPRPGFRVSESLGLARAFCEEQRAKGIEHNDSFRRLANMLVGICTDA